MEFIRAICQHIVGIIACGIAGALCLDALNILSSLHGSVWVNVEEHPTSEDEAVLPPIVSYSNGNQPNLSNPHSKLNMHISTSHSFFSYFLQPGELRPGVRGRADGPHGRVARRDPGRRPRRPPLGRSVRIRVITD